MEDIFRGSAFGGEVLDVSVDGSDGSDGSSGGGSGFGVSDLLRAVISLGFSGGLRGVTFVSAVSLFTASKAKSFSDASSSISRRELL